MPEALAIKAFHEQRPGTLFHLKGVIIFEKEINFSSFTAVPHEGEKKIRIFHPFLLPFAAVIRRCGKGGGGEG